MKIWLAMIRIKHQTSSWCMNRASAQEFFGECLALVKGQHHLHLRLSPCGLADRNRVETMSFAHPAPLWKLWMTGFGVTSQHCQSLPREHRLHEQDFFVLLRMHVPYLCQIHNHHYFCRQCFNGCYWPFKPWISVPSSVCWVVWNGTSHTLKSGW